MRVVEVQTFPAQAALVVDGEVGESPARFRLPVGRQLDRTRDHCLRAANCKITHFSSTRAKHCGTTAVKSNPMRFVRSTICSIPSGKAESAFSIRAIPVRDKTRGLFYGK